MTSSQANTQKIIHRFLGGSLVASPAVKFNGKDGRLVDLPDRLTLRVDGEEMPLSIQAFDALQVAEQESPELSEFLRRLRNPQKVPDAPV